MRPLDDSTAAAISELLDVETTQADRARMVTLAGPQIAVVARTHLPFDSEPSHLVRGLTQGKRA